jgi:hypothetical protein
METFHAPAGRAAPESIRQDYNDFEGFENVRSLIDALPFIAAILNVQRQVVYGNQALLDAMGYNDLQSVLGMRPGELINCVHASENEGGCGTSESCRYCGAVNAIWACMKTGEAQGGECRITAREGDKESSYDFDVSASPFVFRDKSYIVLSFKDISSEKRRSVLERIFFHDIINTAGGLRGFLEFIQTTENPEEAQDYLNTATRLSDDLLDEIEAQRQLLAAERGELKSHPVQYSCARLLYEVRNTLQHHWVAEGKSILLAGHAQDILFSVDPVLLRRVMINLTKNALEACQAGQVVTLGFEPPAPETVVFFVHNPGVMPRSVQLQLFQRSFSTKDASRGLGTYSIKLLTEQYLKGRVSFVSQAGTGTRFTIHLPLGVPE